jgi:predicted nucleotidyltransferase
MSSIQAVDPVSASLFPKSRCAVLGLLFGHPDRGFYLREIAERTGLGVGQVQREVQRLCGGGILRRSRKGRHVYFQADESCPAYEELRGLVTKTIGAAAVLRQALSPLSRRIAAAFIFGSVARGEERSESDLDLMVIGEISFAEVVEAIRDAESHTGRAINATVYPPGEFQAKLTGGHHFLNSVMKREKLFVAGSEDELRAVLEEQLASET